MRKPSPIADVVMHPVRLRIIQQLGSREVTTADLRSALPDVPLPLTMHVPESPGKPAAETPIASPSDSREQLHAERIPFRPRSRPHRAIGSSAGYTR